MLRVLGLDNKVLWQEIVEGFTQHDVFYLPEYTNPLRLHGDGEPVLFHYESGETRAINVAMKRDIAGAEPFMGRLPDGQLFDLSTPYGYGGFLVEGDRSEAAMVRLNAAYTEYCRDNGIVSEFVRFHPLLDNQTGLEPLYDIIPMGRTITIDLSSPEIILANIQKGTRNRIRKAQSNGITIMKGDSPELFAKFTELYTETMDRTGALPYYYFGSVFFDLMRTSLPDNATIFYAVYDSEIVAMELMLHCNGKMHSHLQGSRREYQHLCPVHLMSYTQALWGYEHGCKQFHLGGGLGSEEDSIFQYKKSYNPNSTSRFHMGRRIFDQQEYDQLVGIRMEASDQTPRPSFFPEYRA